MYRKICAQVSSQLAVFDDLILNLRDEEGPQKHWLSELSPDGTILSDAPIPDRDLQTIGLECGQCMVEYRSGGESSLICFSPKGEGLVSIGGLGGYPEVIPRGGLHFLTEAWRTRLLALRDLGGRGLEEVWRLDLAESDRHVGWQGPVPGQVNFLNLYGDGVWATSHKRTYRLDAATGRVLEVRDYLLPEFLVAEGIGHALRLCAYQRMDMARGILLRNSPVEKFAYRGREYHCDFTDLCLHDGLLYVSVALWNGGGLHLLAAFDTQAERFVWHDAWGGCSLDSVHVVGDRLIACDGDEVRIYARE